jgi:hypothetical protein
MQCTRPVGFSFLTSELKKLFRKVMEAFNKLPSTPNLVEDNKLSMQLKNGSRIVSLPGEEANIRGYSSVDLIVEDEASHGFLMNCIRAIRPMVAVSNGSIILMSTPFGKRGHFYEEWRNGDDWLKIEIPATKCPRISEHFLEKERKSLGDWWFNQEYMCQFVEAEDQFFKYQEVMHAIDPTIEPIEIL